MSYKSLVLSFLLSYWISPPTLSLLFFALIIQEFFAAPSTCQACSCVRALILAVLCLKCSSPILQVAPPSLLVSVLSVTLPETGPTFIPSPSIYLPGSSSQYLITVWNCLASVLMVSLTLKSWGIFTAVPWSPSTESWYTDFSHTYLEKKWLLNEWLYLSDYCKGSNTHLKKLTQHKYQLHTLSDSLLINLDI